MRRYTGIITKSGCSFRFLFSPEPLKIPTEKGILDHMDTFKGIDDDYIFSEASLFNLSKIYTGELDEEVYCLGYIWFSDFQKRIVNEDKLERDLSLGYSFDWTYLRRPELRLLKDIKKIGIEINVFNNISNISICKIYQYNLGKTLGVSPNRLEIDYMIEKFRIYYVINRYEIYL